MRGLKHRPIFGRLRLAHEQRKLNPAAPNQVWTGDITYIATDEGWLYLAAVLDLHSRQVVGLACKATCAPI